MKLFVATNPRNNNEIRITADVSSAEALLLTRFLGGVTANAVNAALLEDNNGRTPATGSDLEDAFKILYPLFDKLDDVTRRGKLAAVHGVDPELTKLVELTAMLAQIAKQAKEGDEAAEARPAAPGADLI